MAVSADLLSNRVSILLNDGTTASGAVKTKSVSLGSLSKSGYTRQGAINVVNKLYLCLDRSISSIREVVTSDLSE